VRKLEEAGIIQGYHAEIDRSKLGLPVVAFIQLRCAPDICLFKSGCAEQFPEVIEMYKTAGSHCALLKVAVESFAHLEGLNERLGDYGQQVTTIVTSCVLDHRSIDQLKTDADATAPTNTKWLRQVQ
jgi:Lrp/AsnC family leucine-responsive transcriptional regulator